MVFLSNEERCRNKHAQVLAQICDGMSLFIRRKCGLYLPRCCGKMRNGNNGDVSTLMWLSFLNCCAY